MARNALPTEIKSSPPERAREEVFEPILFDTTSICHKISIKLFLVNDIIYLLRCFKICFSYVIPLPRERRVI